MSISEVPHIDQWNPFAKKGDDESDEPPIVDQGKPRGDGALLPIERDITNERVHVLDSVVPLRPEPGPETPKDKKFRHFTIDKSTLLVLDKIATAVEMRDPCLLEGETSTSKTSSIEYLANRTNHEVIRANMNGQSDTSELIGKFIPNDGNLRLSFEEMLKHPELLHETSRAIILRAREEKRALTLFESQKVTQAEGMEVPDWRWQDGVIPRAMREGKWVILDEINLAEPQILERINPVLERSPSLTITEDGGQKIEVGGQGDAKLHRDFRILATMNPAEYQGRSAMSPAYKDRWTSYIYADRPTQADWLAMGMNVVYGEQPEVKIRDQVYKAENSEPIDRIGEVPNFREFLERLAKFQAKIEELSRTKVIGKGKKEPYIFTRRGLIEFFEFLATKTIYDRAKGEQKDITNAPKEIIQRALQYYYLDKIAGEEDTKKVTDLLDAIGIGEEKWTVEFTAKAEKEYLKPKNRPAGETDIEEETSSEIKVGDWVKLIGSATHAGERGVVRKIDGDILTVQTNGDGCEHRQERVNLVLEKTEKGKGREPRDFLDKFFRWAKGAGWNAKESWSWKISEDGTIVDMQISARDIPKEFIDQEIATIGGTGFTDGTDIAGLLEKLDGKKVESLVVGGKWFLQTS